MVGSRSSAVIASIALALVSCLIAGTEARPDEVCRAPAIEFLRVYQHPTQGDRNIVQGRGFYRNFELLGLPEDFVIEAEPSFVLHKEDVLAVSVSKMAERITEMEIYLTDIKLAAAANESMFLFSKNNDGLMYAVGICGNIISILTMREPYEPLEETPGILLMLDAPGAKLKESLAEFGDKVVWR